MADDPQTPRWQRLRKLAQDHFWDPDFAARNPVLRGLMQIARALAIIGRGIWENQLTIRAAGLSYFTLLSIGPILVVVLLVGSFFIDPGEDTATRALVRVVEFIAPPLVEYEELVQSQAASEGEAVAGEGASAVDQTLVELIETFLENAGSRAGGLINIAILLYLVISLLSLIEVTLNEIWGVRRGRPIVQRVVYYWSLLSLGTILFFASFTVLSGSTFTGIFEVVPLIGGQLAGIVRWFMPLLSFLAIALLLATFYKFFPSVTVAWIPALVGGVVVAILLSLNNVLSFVYVRQVIAQRSFYGSLGIVTLFMFSLYVFWFILLLGGQITYAVQNLGVLLRQRSWENVNHSTRQVLALGALVLIARRFHACEEAPTADDLSRHLNVPGRLLNRALGDLEDRGWLHTQTIENEHGEEITHYQPSRPLQAMTLGDLHFGGLEKADQGPLDQLREVDPLITWYLDQIETKRTEMNREDLAHLLEAHPLTT